MDIRIEVAIDALHAPGKVDILQVNRLGKLLRIIVSDRLIVQRLQRALAVFLENRPEDPSVTMVVGELRVFQLGIQLRHFFQELGVSPVSPEGGGLGVPPETGRLFRLGRILLLLRVHVLPVRLLVPPRVPEVGIHEEVTLVHMAGHALAGGYASRELVLDRMSFLPLGDHRIGGKIKPLVPVL